MDENRLKQLSRRAVSGQASDEELDALLAALDGDCADASMRRAWSDAAGVLSPDVATEMWRRIASRIDSEEMLPDADCEEPAADARQHTVRNDSEEHSIPEPQSRKGLWLRRVIAAAVAAVLLALAGGVGWLSARSTDRSSGEFTMTVDRGQKAQMTLPDGSRVWLNSGTTLAYDARFGAGHRTLRLDGEAYFDVARDPKRPFVVHAGDVAVKALGTKFNVKAYPQDSLVTATLAHGRVEVSDGRHTLTLNPMDVATYATRSRRMELSTTDNLMLAEYWRTDRLVFDGERLGNICRTIERMYGIDISITERRLEDIRFTGTIRNNSLSNVFLLLSLSYPLNCRIDGEHVTIEPRD